MHFVMKNYAMKVIKRMFNIILIKFMVIDKPLALSINKNLNEFYYMIL